MRSWVLDMRRGFDDDGRKFIFKFLSQPIDS